MKGLLEEIREIPHVATQALSMHHSLRLPTGIPYVGMGSSYYAPLTLYYCGVDIEPVIASEYFLYRDAVDNAYGDGVRSETDAVLISQSGESSETVWCLDRFKKVTAIVNTVDSTLAHRAATVVALGAGPEEYSSTKTYVATLVALYCGFGIDPTGAVDSMTEQFDPYLKQAEADGSRIAAYMKDRSVSGLYVVGSGPNYGTALEGALTLSETTKYGWIGMTAAMFDHGPKEASNDAVVVLLNAGGKDSERLDSLKKTLSENSNALVIELTEETVSEKLSPLIMITRLNLIMNSLADELEVGDTFTLGGKVTRV